MQKVTIIGGGLAGMTAALRLLERGFRVSIYESATRLGGKAGANKNGDEFNDHGYHIFPEWYVNTWQLVDELGIRNNFVDLEDISELRAGKFPSFATLRSITSLKYAWRNLTSGFMPIPDMFLFFYAVLDIASQPYQLRLPLDHTSVAGFLNSRFYATRGLEQRLEEVILKAITVPSYDVSAMTVRKVMRFWIKYPSPFVRIVRGNLQTYFIEPFQHKLQELGCEIHFSKRLVRLQTKDSRITQLQFMDQTTQKLELTESDIVILAIPPEQVVKLLDDELYAAAPDLSKILYLQSQPMVALDIFLTRKIKELPQEHVNLAGTKLGLSFIDISGTWEGHDTTTLNVIASDFNSVRTLSDQKAVDLLIEELRRYVPFEKAEISKYVFQPHREEPLFLNTDGAWHFRPKTSTELSNLYLAGDYCRSYVDLTCMEAAVSSGLIAAEAVRLAAGDSRPVENKKPDEPAQWLLILAKFILIPIAALAVLIIRLRGRNSPPHALSRFDR